MTAERSGGPASFAGWTSYPARNISTVSPNWENAETITLSWAMPRIAGPTMIPPRISSTTAGSGNHWLTMSETMTAMTPIPRQIAIVAPASSSISAQRGLRHVVDDSPLLGDARPGHLRSRGEPE